MPRNKKHVGKARICDLNKVKDHLRCVANNDGVSRLERATAEIITALHAPRGQRTRQGHGGYSPLPANPSRLSPHKILLPQTTEILLHYQNPRTYY